MRRTSHPRDLLFALSSLERLDCDVIICARCAPFPIERILATALRARGWLNPDEPALERLAGGEHYFLELRPELLMRLAQTCGDLSTERYCAGLIVYGDTVLVEAAQMTTKLVALSRQLGKRTVADIAARAGLVPYTGGDVVD